MATKATKKCESCKNKTYCVVYAMRKGGESHNPDNGKRLKCTLGYREVS